MAEVVVEAHGVVKSYDGRMVLDGVDLQLERGRCVAVLGPNGAGKTTFLEILEGYRSRDGGDVRVLGTDPAKPTAAWRDRVGLMLQSASLPADLTVAETVSRFASCYHRPRSVPDVLRQVGLADRPDTRAGRLSGGQLRRLDLAVALVGDPDLVFLDEPTTGFDPVARRQAWTVLKGLTDAGTSVLLTTHYLDEAAALAEQLVVVAAGRVVAAGSPDELAQSGAGSRIRLAAGVLDTAPDLLRSRFTRDEQGLHLQTASLEADLHALTGWALDHSVAAGRDAGRRRGVPRARVLRGRAAGLRPHGGRHPATALAAGPGGVAARGGAGGRAHLPLGADPDVVGVPCLHCKRLIGRSSSRHRTYLRHRRST